MSRGKLNCGQETIEQGPHVRVNDDYICHSIHTLNILFQAMVFPPGIILPFCAACTLVTQRAKPPRSDWNLNLPGRAAISRKGYGLPEARQIRPVLRGLHNILYMYPTSKLSRHLASELLSNGK